VYFLYISNQSLTFIHKQCVHISKSVERRTPKEHSCKQESKKLSTANRNSESLYSSQKKFYLRYNIPIRLIKDGWIVFPTTKGVQILQTFLWLSSAQYMTVCDSKLQSCPRDPMSKFLSMGEVLIVDKVWKEPAVLEVKKKSCHDLEGLFLLASTTWQSCWLMSIIVHS